MADAYSFDVDKEAMQSSYRAVFDAYLRIFGRLDLDVRPGRGPSGAIGGDVNHEFMVPSAVGEDHFVQCPSCGYAANVEAAEPEGGADPSAHSAETDRRGTGRPPHAGPPRDRAGGGVLAAAAGEGGPGRT